MIMIYHGDVSTSFMKHHTNRSGDGHISTTAFEWKFEKHIDGNCLECDWNVDGV